jgi:hypothetical protein
VYYWQVAAKNSGGSSSSAIWSFTTLVAAPVLTAPAAGATGVTLTPTLSWTAAARATSYDVYFGTAASPPLATNTTGTSYAPGTLAAGTVYYWRVSARNSSGSNSSATWSFTTQVAPPALVSPASGAASVAQTPSLSWNASAGAASYDVYFGTSSPPPLAGNTTGRSYAPGTLQGDTVYYWQVAAKNSGGSASSAIWSFTTVMAAPVLTAPAKGATNVPLAPALTWSAVAGATSHDVYFGTATSPPLAANTTATSYTPGKLGGATPYYWRVVAKNSGGSNSSATWSFTTQVAAPILVSPASGATGVSQTTPLSWNASTGATSYDVYFGTSSPPALAGNTTGRSYAPGSLLKATVYYWRVTAKNSGGSADSAIWSFTTR